MGYLAEKWAPTENCNAMLVDFVSGLGPKTMSVISSDQGYTLQLMILQTQIS